MSNVSEPIAPLAEQLRAAHARRGPVGPIDLAGLQRVLSHVPEDMTVTVESGVTLAALQATLRSAGQWLPLDPAGAEQLTIRDLLDYNLSGPHRFGCGTARDWLIGLKAVLADGRVIESGGKVVKNVAGYDLHKLLIGARGELAVIVEATFKLSPLPASVVVLAAETASTAEATKLAQAILLSPVNPVVLDLVCLETAAPRLVLAFAGTPRETEWQREQIACLADWQDATLEHDSQFHRLLAGRAPMRNSTLPAKLPEALAGVSAPWLARAGNGVIYSLPTGEPVTAPALHPLHACIRQLFDPHGVLQTSE